MAAYRERRFTQEYLTTLPSVDDDRVEFSQCSFDSLETVQRYFSIIAPNAKKVRVVTGDMSFPESQLTILLSGLRSTNITSLKLSRNYITTSNALILLGEELRGTNITRLHLSYNHITSPETWKALREGLRDTAVTSLKLSYSAIGHHGKITELTEGLIGTNITILDLCGNGINTPEALTALTNGLRGTNVTTLNLSGNGIGTPEALTALMEGLRGTNVTTLDLFFNDIRHPAAFTALTEGLRKTKVTTLNLRSNNLIKPDTVTALTKGLIGTNVTSLDLSYTGITPAGLAILYEFAKSYHHITNITLDTALINTPKGILLMKQLQKNREAFTEVKEGLRPNVTQNFPQVLSQIIGEYDGSVPISEPSRQAEKRLGVDDSFANSLMQSAKEKSAVAGPLSHLDRARAVSHSSHAL
jgi:hypothetical protein